MPNELTPQQTFENKIKDRIRESIGDLIPDEVLADMTKKAINEMFFTRKEETRGYNSKVVVPSWFENEVHDLLKSRIDAILQKWISDNSSELVTLVQDYLVKNSPQLIAAFFIGVLNRQTHDVSNDVFSRMVSTLQQSPGSPFYVPSR